MKDSAKVRILEQCIESSRKGKREAFLREGQQIMQFSQRHAGPENPDYDKDEFWGAKITKTAEARQLFGNAIYQQNPTVGKSMKAADPAAADEADCTVAYLKQAMRETLAEKHRKRAVDQAVTWGRGVAHTVLDNNNRPVSKWFPVKDYYQDPDALSEDEVRWRARRRYSQRSELQRRFPEAKAVIAAISAVQGHDEAGDNKSKPRGDERYFRHDPCDSIEWFTCYFRVGLHNFKGGLDKKAHEDTDPESVGPEKVELDNGAKRYVVARSGGSYKLIDEGPWEIPFWKLNSWPIEYLDLIDDDEGCWAVSPLAAGLPWEKAINELTQKALAKSHFNLRDILVIMQNNGVKLDEEDVERIVNGEDIEIIQPEGLTQDAKATDALHHLQFKPISQEFERLINLCEMYFEKATGLNELMYTGQGAGQFRNAAAANLAASASTSRVDEFRQRVELWTERLATNEAFAARVMLDQEQIATVVGPEKAQAWRRLAPPREHLRALLLEQMPELAQNPEQVEMMLDAMSDGTVTIDAWVHEWSVQIIPGSTMRPSVQQQRATAEWLMNQPFSAALGAGMIEPAWAMMDFAMEVNQVDPSIRANMQQAFAVAQQNLQAQTQQPQGQSPTAPTGV